MYIYNRIKEKCKEQNIPISKLEKDLKFGNGYLSKQTRGSIKLERIELISKYLDVPVKELVEENQKKEKKDNEIYTKDEKEIINIYRKLNDDGKEQLKTLINSVTQLYENDKT